MPDDERHPHEHRQPHHHLDRVRSFNEEKDLIKHKRNQKNVDGGHEVSGPEDLDHKEWIPSHRRSARRVAPTSWTRKPRAPSLTAQSAAAIDPSSRSSGGRGESSLPSHRPMKDFRETPTIIGRPKDRKADNPFKSAMLCSNVFPKPIPGSRITRSSQIF